MGDFKGIIHSKLAVFRKKKIVGKNYEKITKKFVGQKCWKFSNSRHQNASEIKKIPQNKLIPEKKKHTTRTDILSLSSKV